MTEVKQIREVWQRLFGIVEAVRKRRGLPSLVEHLQTLEKYQANSAHIEEMLKGMFPRNHRRTASEFDDDQTDFWDAELNERIKKIFASEKATPPVLAEPEAQQRQEGETAMAMNNGP